MSADEAEPAPALLESLTRAVAAAPDDHSLRLHLAELLRAAGRPTEAVTEIARVLAADPTHEAARALMSAVIAAPAARPAAPASEPAAESKPPAAGFDWRAAEDQLRDAAPDDTAVLPGAWEVVGSDVRLADVAGMRAVKERLELAFLAPMRNTELRKAFGKSLRGGLLMYGPPGCGKTYIARAVAGELGARFLAVTLADILDMWVGSSERNMRDLFLLARREAPCVLFLDEIDALGRKRSQTRLSATRGTVTQLLAELDSVHNDNEGVFVLAATNHPWDVDEALRRPGRLDRTLLVLPPDKPAREAILQAHLRERPVDRVDLGRLAAATEGYSGADLAHVAESAAERVLVDSIAAGSIRLITQADLETAVREVRPSMAGWFETARNVVMFADDDDTYADLRAYLKKARRW